MRVQYLASACVLIEHQGTRVLCDPWLTEGIYYGSWFHYPPLRFVPEDFADVDYIYISHIHPDHFDPETLKRLPRALPLLIHDYEEKFVLRMLNSLGFENVREIGGGETVALGPDFHIAIRAADDCDPQLCGQFFGCPTLMPSARTRQIDSLAVFHGGGKTVVNINDCPYALARGVCDAILDTYKSVDFLMVGYSGAGPYPQCFDNLDAAQKSEKAQAKRRQFLHQATQYITHLRPAHFLPFAGQYTLGGSLAALNADRGVPELEELSDIFAALRLEQPDLEHPHPGVLTLLNSGAWFDVDTQCSSARFVPPDPAERENYIRDKLMSRAYVYETPAYHVPPCDQTDLTPLVLQAQARMLKQQDRLGGYRSNWTVYLDTQQEWLYAVPMNGCPARRVARGAEQEPFVRIGLDYSLLQMILKREAHFNNAEIGSHLRFHRQPDRFERGLYHFLCYLHC